MEKNNEQESIYFEHRDLNLLRIIFERSKNLPIYLEADNLSEEELKVICSAHQFAFICPKKDMRKLEKIFKSTGHKFNNLWREKLKKQETQEIFYSLRFREKMAA